MALLGPIIFLGPVADAVGWAHCNVQGRLPMAPLGPIILLGAAAEALGWARFKARMQLPMASLRPIIFCSCCRSIGTCSS